MKFLPPKSHEYEFQMVSFVDVIFVLLSFFVLGSSFKMPEKDFGLGYSQAGLPAGTRAEDFPQTIRVELRRHGPAVSMRVGPVNLGDDSYDAIRAKLAEINMPEIGVLVAADPALSVDELARALDAVLASPMKKVSVASLAGGGPANSAISLSPG